ncbi:SCO family protein [Halomonas urumqiensis]|nr:SCO family protein [Halomonas urumqiensis]
MTPPLQPGRPNHSPGDARHRVLSGAVRRLSAIPLFALSLALLTGTALAHEPHTGDRSNHRTAASQVAVELVDLPLVDHQGTTRRFRSEVIGDSIVAVTVVYTSCTTVCPVISAVFQRVQAQLEEELGERVVLISISVDPARDTPRRLADYRQRFAAQPGWVWLTGERGNVMRVLDGLGAYTPDPDDHPIMVVVGDGRSDQWRRDFGLQAPDDIVARIHTLLAQREAP